VGRYAVKNVSSNIDVWDALSDLTRPLGNMSENPFGQARIESIHMRVKISPTPRLLRLEGLSLDKNRYVPGDTVAVKAQLWRWHGERFMREVRVKLPDDLPDGRYRLVVGGATTAGQALRARHPEMFDPRDLPQLLEALRLVAQSRQDRLYAALYLNEADLAVDRQVIAAPDSIVHTLREAWPAEVAPAARALVVEQPLEDVLVGQQQIEVIVEKHLVPEQG
jgi:hypothetical protein